MADQTPTLARRRIGISLNVFVQVLIVLALVGAVNWLVSRHYRRFDWTQTGYNKLADKTKQYLTSLKEPVQAILYLPSRGGNDMSEKTLQDIRNLLEEFKYVAKGKLLVEYVDPDRNRPRAEELAEKYKFDEPNVIIFVCGTRHKFVPLRDVVEFDYDPYGMGGPRKVKAFKGEGAFLGAIQTVTEEKPPRVYFLTGHGERDPDSSDDDKGYSGLQQYIKRDNIIVEKWNLLEKQALPTNMNALVIAGPSTKLAPAEIAAIDEYVKKRDGRLFILLNPRRETGLENYLAGWGVQVDNNIAFGVGNLGGIAMPIDPLGYDYAPQHPVTRKLEGVNTTFPSCRTVRRAMGEPVVDGPPPTITELVKTPASFWGETDFESRRVSFDPKTDMAGPLNLAVAVEASKPPGVDLETGKYRMVVVGSSSFVGNGALGEGNLVFFMNGLNWLLQREQLIGVGPKLPQEFRLDMTPRQANAVFLLVVLGLPLGVTTFGLLVWARRRK